MKVQQKLKLNKAPTDNDLSRAKEVMQAIDFQCWLEKRKVKEFKLLVFEKLGFRLTKHTFDVLRIDACKWWKSKRYAAPRRDSLLVESEWRYLRRVVEEMSLLVQGRPIEHAVLIISTKFRCNETILRNLTKDAQIWSKSA